MALMKISQYQQTFFVPGSEPVARTVKAWIDDGEIPGRVIGGIYYVEIDEKAEEADPVNQLVSRVLRNDATT